MMCKQKFRKKTFLQKSIHYESFMKKKILKILKEPKVTILFLIVRYDMKIKSSLMLAKNNAIRIKNVPIGYIPTEILFRSQ